MTSHFPTTSVPEWSVRARIDAALDAIKQSLAGTLPGKPDTPPHPLGIEIWSRLSTLNPNHSGVHTWDVRDPQAEGRGSRWESTRNLERELVGMLADLYGLPSTAVDGYVTSGATEANMAALWIGRNRLLDDPSGCGASSGARVAVIAPRTSHFSVRKTCNLLGLGEGLWRRCTRCGMAHEFVPATDGSGLHLVDVDDGYRLDLSAFQSRLTQLVRNGVRRVLVVLTAGTTITGSVDPIAEVCRVLRITGEQEGLLSYLHLDAALGGLVLPFVGTQRPPGPSFDWSQWPEVASLCVDWHKMGLVPYGAGTLLARKDLMTHVSRAAGYITTGIDATVLGSRSGAIAAACWGVAQIMGFEGFSGVVSRCMEMAATLRASLNELEGIDVLPAAPVNVVTISLAADTRNSGRARAFLGRHGIHPEWNSSRRGECPIDLFPIYIMPHVQQEDVDRFVEELDAFVD